MGSRRGGDWWARVGVVALFAMAAVTAGGCQYLFGFPAEPPFTDPKSVEAYQAGRATVTIGSDAAIVLDKLPRPGTYDTTFGGSVTFRNDQGWYVQVTGASPATGFGQMAWVQVDRIVDGRHWTTWDSSRCIVTITAVNEKALRGTASCKGLRWADALGGGFGSMDPPYIEGELPFDAEITFEATPTTSQTG